MSNTTNTIIDTKEQTPNRVRILCLVLLVLAVLRTNYNISDALTPINDESNYLGGAHQIYSQGGNSLNLFIESYILIFKYISEDPVVAHYVMRVLVSLISVTGMFLFFSKISFINIAGAMFAALLWNINILNMPIVQNYSISIFAFGASCYAGFFFLISKKYYVKLISYLAIISVGFIRPEYHLATAIIGLYVVGLWLWKEEQTKPLIKKLTLLATLGALLLVSTVTVQTIQNRTLGFIVRLDKYLYFGLSQCYSRFVTIGKEHPGFSDFGESYVVMNEVFPGANTFSQALIVNPKETVSYLLRNGFTNFLTIHRLVQQHSIILPMWLNFSPDKPPVWPTGFEGEKYVIKIAYYVLLIERVSLLMILAIGWFFLAKKLIFIIKKKKFWMMDNLASAVYLSAMALITVVPMALLVPQLRYWVTLIPLFFLGGAYLVTLVSKRFVLLEKKILIILMVFLFSPSIFMSGHNIERNYMKELILILRNAIEQTGKAQVRVLGGYPQPVCSMASPRKCIPVGIFEIVGQSSYEAEIKSGKFDLLYLPDGLEETKQYDIEKEFFERFFNNPDSYSYKILVTHFPTGKSIYKKIADY